MIWLFFHALVVTLMYTCAGRVENLAWLTATVLMAGHSLACIAFYAHDLSHGSVIRNRTVVRLTEGLFLGLLLIAPTVWRRVHNHAHHSHYNTPNDPDRQFFSDETKATTRWYIRLFYPNEDALTWNPLVLVHFIPYIIRNTITALSLPKYKLSIVPARANFRGGEVRVVVLEILIIISIQLGLFIVCGLKLLEFSIMFVGVNVVASAFTMVYIFTNHFLNPNTPSPDPITNTTSVIVPRWIDKLHGHFSFHTEHHLFPGMNSNYYPQLSELLMARYPNTYRRIPIGSAWRDLWRARAFINRPAGSAVSQD